jgi:hypothetical protein
LNEAIVNQALSSPSTRDNVGASETKLQAEAGLILMLMILKAEAAVDDTVQ